MSIRSFFSFLVLVLGARFICGVSAVAPATFAGQRRIAHINDPDVILDTTSGTTVVYSSTTGQQIPQGLALDGSGIGFSSSAVLWIVFSFVLGVPLLLAGFRWRRLALGAAVGTAAVLASWAAIANTLDNVGISDIALTICTLVLFVMGFGLGLLEMSRTVAILVLGILGGLAVGVRIILLRSGLLVPDLNAFFANWFIIGVCGIAGGILVIWKQKYGILNGCASTGSFFCALGFDLVINQQSGMSRGLRYLFDRNSYHVLDTLKNGYSPPTTTVIILAVSLGVTPASAFAQWKVFKRHSDEPKDDTLSGSLWEPQELPQDEEALSVPQQSMDLPDSPTTEKGPKPSFSDDAKTGRSS